MSELSKYEDLGLQYLAARQGTTWMYKELRKYYLTVKVHGPDIDKLTQALADSKTKAEIQSFIRRRSKYGAMYGTNGRFQHARNIRTVRMRAATGPCVESAYTPFTTSLMACFRSSQSNGSA